MDRAATCENRRCEMTEDYWPIIKSRIAWAEKEYAETADKAAEAPTTLF